MVGACDDAWIAVAISYTGLVALGVPEESLQSFPEAFRVNGFRADILLDQQDRPKNWNQPFGSGKISIAISVFSDSEEKWRHTMALARLMADSGVSVVTFRTSALNPATSIRSVTRMVSASPQSKAAVSIHYRRGVPSKRVNSS